MQKTLNFRNLRVPGTILFNSKSRALDMLCKAVCTSTAAYCPRPPPQYMNTYTGCSIFWITNWVSNFSSNTIPYIWCYLFICFNGELLWNNFKARPMKASDSTIFYEPVSSFLFLMNFKVRFCSILTHYLLSGPIAKWSWLQN